LGGADGVDDLARPWESGMLDVMEVIYRNFLFETDLMRAFATGLPAMPTIFVNENGLCFVQRNRRQWEQPKVGHLRHSEAMRYADTFQLAELKSFLETIHQGAAVEINR
jgi:hypothetical protein